MPSYLYVCPACGPFESPISGDVIQCRCGATAKRRFSVSVNRSSLKSEARWDPVVGDYVANNREWEYKLRQGQDAESAKLNMDVKLATVDARDSSGLAELHGHSPERREHDLESERKLKFDKANA